VLLRATPEDFRVDEIPLYPPTGEGEHTFVLVEKRERTTEEVARELARAAGVRPRDVGYAGRKDRVAVATQWFSVPRFAPEAALSLVLLGVRVLEAAAHPHKLRTGHLRGNRFRIVVRDLDAAEIAGAQRRLEDLVRVGMPNRFGAQRFGREGDNAEVGRRLLAGEAPGRDRRRARFMLSALQAEVFNAVLAERQPDLVRLERGDVAVIHGSGALFVVEDPELEAPRAAAFEISATGPIFGTRMLRPQGAVAQREGDILAAHGVDIEHLSVPRGIRLRGTRRALRVRPAELGLEPLAGGLTLGFTLPSGSYATVLVEELLAPQSG
jgi:tRNA pseudouridine13 synthase